MENSEEIYEKISVKNHNEKDDENSINFNKRSFNLNESIISNISSITNRNISKPFEKLIFNESELMLKGDNILGMSQSYNSTSFLRESKGFKVNLTDMSVFSENNEKIDKNLLIESGTYSKIDKETDIDINKSEKNDESWISVKSSIILKENEIKLNNEESDLIRKLIVDENLTNDEVIKAIKYNGGKVNFDDLEELPFWIKCFVLNVPLKKNSSFFKSENKEEYIKNMIQMTKNDAKLYDGTEKDKKEKKISKKVIKDFLITEVESIKKNSNESDSKQSLNKSELSVYSKKSMKLNQKKQNDENNLKNVEILNKKLEDTFISYNKKKNDCEIHDKKEKSFIEEKKIYSEKIQNKQTLSIIDKNKEIDYVMKKHQVDVKKLELLEQVIEKSNEIDEDPRWMSIEDMDLDDNNSNTVSIPNNSLCFLRTENLEKLNEIDKKLNKLEKQRNDFENKKIAVTSKNISVMQVLKDLKSEVKKNRPIKTTKQITNNPSKISNNSRETIFNSKHKNTKLLDNLNDKNWIDIKELRKDFDKQLKSLESEYENKKKSKKYDDDIVIKEYLENVNFDKENKKEKIEDDYEIILKDLENLEKNLAEIKESNKQNEISQKEQELIDEKLKRESNEEKEFYSKNEKILNELIVMLDDENKENAKLDSKINELNENNKINEEQLCNLISKFEIERKKITDEQNEEEKIYKSAFCDIEFDQTDNLDIVKIEDREIDENNKKLEVIDEENENVKLESDTEELMYYYEQYINSKEINDKFEEC